MVASLAAGTATAGHIFAFKWSDATRFACINYLALQWQALTPFAVGITDFGFDAFVVRSYATAHTGGTDLQLTTPANRFKLRTATMGTTLVTDLRIATTAALGQTVDPTFDNHPFIQSMGDIQRTVVASGEEIVVNQPNFVWAPNMANGEHPIVLAQNEGIVIRNRTVWPLTGTGQICIQMRWNERVSF